MVMSGFAIVLVVLVLLAVCQASYDPSVINKIPQEVRRSIDEAVAQKLQSAISAHFEQEYLGSDEDTHGPSLMEKYNRRFRRDISNTTNTTTAKFAEWSVFGQCSAKCGGGQQVRYRTCLDGDCRQIGSFTEVRKCGLFPCVAGSYVLGSIEAYGRVSIPEAKMVKFFSIQGAKYFGYITENELHLLKWSFAQDSYVPRQVIPVTSGVTFDILNTYPRTYLVVIEKALMIFPGRFSKMYYYDPWNSAFKTDTPVTIDVWEPSAAKTFDVFGTAFLGIVNYKTKMISNYGITNTLLVCSGQTKVASCPVGSIITIAQAIYGRVTNYECATGVDVFVSWFQYFATCVVPGAKVKVSKICDSKQSCALTADPVNFANPHGMSCAHTNNYLRITYTCSSISHIGMPIFYKWDGVGLSLISSKKLMTYGAKDIESFSIHDQQYIAVANHRNDHNEYHLDSEIYIYNLDSGRFQSLQKIRTDGAVDWEFFTIGTGLASEYFLVVANHLKVLPNGVKTYEVESVIYKWNWNLFVPFQCIKTYGATKWTALVGDKGRFTLSVSNLYGNATFYNYDGWRFNKASVQPVDDIFVNAQALYAFKQEDDPMFLLHNKDTSYNETRNLYKTTFMKTFPKHELLESTVRAVQEMNRSVYEVVLPNSKEFTESYETMKKDIVFLDEVNLTEHKTFRNILVQGNTTVDTANIRSITLSQADLQKKGKISELNNTISNMYVLLDDANAALVDIVTKSTEQNIASKKTFSYLNVGYLNVSGDMSVDLLNGISLSSMKDNALYLDDVADIGVQFSFNNISLLDLNVRNTFAGIFPNDIVTTNTNETVSGHKTFSRTQFVGKAGNVKTGLLNGTDTADFLTVGDNQTISSDYIFGGNTVVVGNISAADKVNEMNLTAVASDTVMINKPGTVIEARKDFQKIDILGDLTLRNNASINGIHISDLVKIGLNLAADNFGNVTFMSNVTFRSNVIVLGSVNGVDLDEVVFTNVDSIITAPQTIVGDFEATAGVKINGSVNDYNLTDFLYTVGNQTITAGKTFTSNLQISSDVVTTGLVDGVDISEAYAQSLLMNTTQNITAFKTFKNLSAESIICHNCNMLPVIYFIKNECARVAGDVINITGHKRFDTLDVAGSVNVSGSFNGIKIPGDLLVQGQNQTISGDQVFTSNVAAVGNVSVPTVNSVNISAMYDKALPKSNLTIESRITFKDDITVNGNLSVTKEIDGVDLKDVVSTQIDETIVGRKNFTSKVHVNELHVKKITGGLVDGVDVVELEKELLTLSGNQIVKGTKVFERGVSFLGNWSIAGLVDGVNITELYNNAMMLEDDQTISGRKTFVENVRVADSLSVKKLVDNVNLTELALHAIDASETKGQSTITGNVTFENIRLLNNTIVNGLVSSVNLTEIVNDTLMTSGNQVISGKHTIGNLTVSGVVDVDQETNGVDLSEEAIPLHKNTTITGTKVFTEDIRMANVGTKTVNNMNLSKFSERVAYIDEPTLITGFLTLEKDLIIAEDLKVTLSINGINLTDVVSSTIMKDGDQVIDQPISFNTAKFHEVTNTKAFNEIDFTRFSENIVYKCVGPDRPITGNWTFIHLNVQGRVSAINLTVKGKINDVDLTVLDDQTVKELGTYNINGLKRIEGDLTVNDITVSNVNGFHIPSDFVRITGEDLISGKKAFSEDVTVNGDAYVAGTLNGVNIRELTQNIVQLGSKEMISSHVVFKKNVTVGGNLLTKSLNDLNITDQELLLSHGNQTITASKIFSEVNTDEKVVSGNHVNGFDLKKIQNESFISGKKNVLKGVITIIGDVRIEGDLKSGSVDGVKNISSRFYGFNRISSYLRKHIPAIYRSIGVTRTFINQLSGAISNVHQSLDYFTDMQDLMLPYVSTSIDVMTGDRRVWLAMGALSDTDGRFCSNTSVFVRSRSPNGNARFVNKYSVLSNAVTGVKFVKHKSRTYLVSSSSRKNGGCLSGESSEFSTTYIYDSIFDDFMPHASASTYRAAGVYVSTSQGNMTALFANTYNASSCVEQTLHSLRGTTYVSSGSVNGCNVIKSLILVRDDFKTRIAVLGSNKVGYRQLEVFDILKNGSRYVTQVISTHFASDVLHFTDAGWDYIVVANTYDTSEEALSVSYTVPLAIYRLAESGLYELYQNVEVWAALKVRTMKIGIYNYLAIATYKQEIVILKHKGASKWNIVLTIPIQGYGSIKDMTTWTFDNEVFMAVLSADSWNVKYPSKVRIMKGYLTSSVEGSNIMKRVSL